MGLFKKKWDLENPDEKTHPQSMMLSVMGSPGSGKTTLATKLGQYIAMKGYDVLVIYTDMVTPVVPYVTEKRDVLNPRSIGSVLAASHIVSKLVEDNIMVCRNWEHLSFMGLLEGENESSYPEYSQELCLELYRVVSQKFKYVIVDCVSDFYAYPLSAIALQQSNAVLKLFNCDRKSASYYSSASIYLNDEKWHYKEYISVGSNIKKNQAVDSLEDMFGTVRYKLPFSEELERQYLESQLFSKLRYNESKYYRKTLAKLCAEVFGI